MSRYPARSHSGDTAPTAKGYCLLTIALIAVLIAVFEMRGGDDGALAQEKAEYQAGGPK
jgi:hypothetical protein